MNPLHTENEYWTRKRLWRLVWPLVVEQLLLVMVGMADTAMVTSVGEAAVSGVSLVDSLNILLISVFSALATGGAVVASQYMGRRDAENASGAAKQLFYAITAVSAVIAVLCLALCEPILYGVYGHIEADVMADAKIYFILSAVSYPFLAMYNAAAALFRSMGNSRVGMYTSALINVINIGGNALLIYGFKWGVAGAATSSLVSRIVASVILLRLMLPQRPGGISLHGLWPPRFNKGITGSIMKVGMPNALENSVFQIGKLLVARIVSTFGTAAIAGNAISNALATFVNIAGMAISMAMLTVVGQCVGAGDYAGAKRQTRRLMGATHAAMLSVSLVLFLSAPPLMGLFGLSAGSTDIAVRCLRLFCIFAGFLWPPSFGLPNALRAAGDARYTMVVSLVTMWTFRIGTAYLFAYALNMGVYGVWVAMVVDWAARALLFVLRWASGKWQTKSVIQPEGKKAGGAGESKKT